MLSYEYAYICMQIKTAIIEKPNFFNIWKTMHDNIMKLVSTHYVSMVNVNYNVVVYINMYLCILCLCVRACMCICVCT